jgi:hypothetical protein
MPNKRIGTLTALLIFVSALNTSIILLTPCHANAQLSELTEIQNGTFHLSQTNMGITAETFKTDKYIDNWQAEYFSNLSKPELNTPADDNYPFSLVGSYLLDTDLEIDYEYDNILCSAYPQTAYLSRNDYSLYEYTDTRPPTYYINKIKGVDPLTGEKVTAMHLDVHNDEIFVDEIFQMSPNTNHLGINEPPGSEYVEGEVLNSYIRVDSSQVAVWVRMDDTELMKKCNPPAKDTTCLHPSDIRPPKIWYIVRTGNIGPFQTGCTQDPPLPHKQQCYYPFAPERTSAAATNWSYNYNLRKGSAASSKSTTTDSARSVNAPQTNSSCQTCK